MSENTFLLEIYTEEVPSGMQLPAEIQLRRYFETFLKDLNLTYQVLETGVTPQRLTLWLKGLPFQQADFVEEKRGPRVGAPAQALEGFLKSNSTSLEDLEKRTTAQGQFYFLKQEIKGKEVSVLFKEAVESLLKTFQWPKAMRWGECEFKWIRPLKHVLCLFNKETLQLNLPHPFITQGAYTYGHRFLTGKELSVSSIDTYREQLANNFVCLLYQERCSQILEGYKALATAQGLSLKKALESQVKVVAGLVEWPVPTLGVIEERFLKLPAIVLETSMWSHQYFTPTYRSDQQIAPYFLCTLNHVDHSDQKITGYQRVLKARLEDAFFFYEKDKKTPFSLWQQNLTKQVFQQKLGTVSDRVARFEILATHFFKEDTALTDAALLAKADLMSEIVQEFPELQGQMGAHYLSLKGYNPAIVEAVEKQYALGTLAYETAQRFALIERIERLAAFFWADLVPTGSKDPFALRRAAHEVISLCLSYKSLKEVPLLAMLLKAATVLQSQQSSTEKPDAAKLPASLEEKLVAFFVERLRSDMKDRFNATIANATLNKSMRYEDVFNFNEHYQVAQVLLTLSNQAKMDALIALFKRVKNALQKSEEDDDSETVVNDKIFELPAEKTLYQEVQSLKKHYEQEKNVTSALQALLLLEEPLALFFETVFVNHEDSAIKKNRLALLKEVQQHITRLADFTAF